MNEIASTTGPDQGNARPSDRCRYVDIAVHLDGSTEDEARIACAEALAGGAMARVTGLFTSPLPDPAMCTGAYGTRAFELLLEAAKAKADRIAPRLRQRLSTIEHTTELRRIEAFPGALEQAVASEARWNDLFVATCARDDMRWEAMIERVMFDGGRGLCLLPPQVRPRTALRTILIGWVDSRQSARAVAEAMPLIAQGTRVCIASVCEEAHGRMGGAEALTDIAAHLARHGVTATASVLEPTASPAESLLVEAARISADAIVIGAYGHSRLREWVLGGVTRHMLAASPVPLFLAH